MNVMVRLGLMYGVVEEADIVMIKRRQCGNRAGDRSLQ